MRKTILSAVAVMTGFLTAQAQNVNIPDANFKAYLVGNAAINTNSDNEIQVSEAQAYNGAINCGLSGIADLTGIEAFTALTSLYCNDNLLTSLNVSQNTALTTLQCSGNQLMSLNVSQNTALTTLDCSYTQLTNLNLSQNTNLIALYCIGNQLTSLDISQNVAMVELYCYDNLLTSLNLSQNTAIIHLNCSSNQLTSLNLNQNTALTNLTCYDNLLTSIDISQNTALVQLYCQNNQLTSLNVSQNSSLTVLQCSNNQLSSLDVSQNTGLVQLVCTLNQLNTLDVSNNSALAILNFGANQLTSFDASNNTALTNLLCGFNQLSSLNVANGNNTNLGELRTPGNDNLACIQVDDEVYSTANWTGGSYQISALTSFSENCAPCIVNIPDANFKAYLVGNSSINTNSDTEIQCSEATAFTSQIWAANLGISDLTGIEAFTNLISLNCSNNLLTTIDVSNNTSLVELNIAGNSISSLNVSANLALFNLFCDYNNITQLDVSGNLSLGKLNISENNLSSLDLSANTQLFELGCEANLLTSLSVKNGNNLNVTGFYTSGNPNLTCIEVDDAAYSLANWTNIDANSSFSENCNGTMSINDFSQQNIVRIFPNPTSTLLNVETREHIRVKIVTVLGETIKTQELHAGANSIDVIGLTNGIYFIQSSNGESLKFVKE